MDRGTDNPLHTRTHTGDQCRGGGGRKQILEGAGMVGCIQGCEAKAPIISVHACNLGFRSKP